MGAGAVLLLLGAVTLGWFGLGEMGEKGAEAQALAERMGSPALGALLADAEGVKKVARDIAEIQKLETELQKEDWSLPAKWAKVAQRASGDGEEWGKDPGKWKDHLIATASQIHKAASEVRLNLAPEFYLGLDSFRQRSPTVAEVPALALHLSVAQRLVEKLFEARQTKEQYTTVCEIRSLTGPGSVVEPSAETGSTAPQGRPGASPTVQERKTFRLEIVCSPEVLYDYIRLLANDEWPFLVTNLSVSNQKQKFPPRSEIAQKLSKGREGNPGESETKGGQKKLLEILAGDESLSCQVDVDFVAWKSFEEATPPKAGKSK